MKKGTKAEKRRQIVDLWNQGYSVLDIRDLMEYKCSHSIETQLRLAGINPKGSSGLDVPKVLALQKAGWNMRMIVDEFNYNYSASEILAAVKAETERRSADVSQKT